MKLIDSHCHLNVNSFDADRDAVLERAKKAGVGQLICIGCRPEDAKKIMELVQEYDQLFAAVALHPADIISESFEKDFQKIADFAQHKKVVAVGETGLDFFRPQNPSREVQEKSLRAHANLAQELQKPLIIHSRAAASETIGMLQTLNGQPFVWHCFSETIEIAKKVIALGGMISFTGIVTFPKSRDLQEVARHIPLEHIMVETDAPFLAPVPERGKRNEPAFVTHTAQFIADLRGMELDEFAQKTTENAQCFFDLPKK